MSSLKKGHLNPRLRTPALEDEAMSGNRARHGLLEAAASSWSNKVAVCSLEVRLWLQINCGTVTVSAIC